MEPIVRWQRLSLGKLCYLLVVCDLVMSRRVQKQHLVETLDVSVPVRTDIGNHTSAETFSTHSELDEYESPLVRAYSPFSHSSSETRGWIAILIAWLCFGSNSVPIKWKSVVDAKVHPVVFTLHRTFWTFVVSHVVLFKVKYVFDPLGLLSGLSWVPAGIAANIAVQHLGIAFGQALWQVTIIATSFIWGFLILRDSAVTSLPGTVGALVFMVGGVVGMSCAFKLQAFLEEKEENERQEAMLPPDDEIPSSFVSSEYIGEVDRSGCNVAKSSTAIGIAAALFNGIWGGSNLVPSKYTNHPGLEFVISFVTGAIIVNITLAALYFCALKFWWRSELPALHLRVMAFPGFLSGTLWALGNMCALYAVDVLGQGIGYSLIQSSVIISGLWGILYFKELRGRAVMFWAVCCAICVIGVIWLALMKKPAGK
eukprot:TRINITY_DN23753_c0_g1_i1.p1 TRINITY_DN23753_c0_g1~~TRINITY_DN23753_c0_g1_i1.p1  ORF type:complete len:426 (+),score=76.83 TRINITY_DN23753_c0_g1_i1:57-1334(+)